MDSLDKLLIMKDITVIKNSIQTIREIKSKIYEYINTTRYQYSLIQDSNIWNQICSSLDVIDDTLLSIEDYIDNDFPQSDGLKYIFTYGILQSLFIQQDAVRHLAEAFNIPFSFSESLIKIRDLRNSSIGHPTKQNTKGKRFYNYVSRIPLSKKGFTLQKTNIEQGRDVFVDVNIVEIIKIQIKEITDLLGNISNRLLANDQNHKNKYKGELMTNIFPDSINYYFEKVGEAIYFPVYNKKKLGLSMLELIEKAYSKFESELIKRQELPGNENLQFTINQYSHAVNKIKDYLTENVGQMEEIDARIYLFYLREEHKYFLEIAKEYDEEYSS